MPVAEPRNIFAELNSPKPTSTCSSAPEDCETEDRPRTRGRATDYFCQASWSRANFNTLYCTRNYSHVLHILHMIHILRILHPISSVFYTCSICRICSIHACIPHMQHICICSEYAHMQHICKQHTCVYATYATYMRIYHICSIYAYAAYMHYCPRNYSHVLLILHIMHILRIPHL